jgi:hypothetical protein
MDKKAFFALVERSKVIPDYALVKLSGWELRELIELALLGRKSILGAEPETSKEEADRRFGQPHYGHEYTDGETT